MIGDGAQRGRVQYNVIQKEGLTAETHAYYGSYWDLEIIEILAKPKKIYR